jgi:hypothetical protein
MNDEGQSVIEFIFMLPMLIGMSALLVNINTAIQIGIVNQQYARAQALNLTYSSPFYPALFHSDGSAGPRVLLIDEGANQMVLGVSDNFSSGNYTPIATQQLVVRKPSLAPSNAPQDESATLIGRVRIRNSVTLCTDNFTYATGSLSNPGSENTSFSKICGSGFTYD